MLHRTGLISQWKHLRGGDFYIHVYFMLDPECRIDFNTVSSENVIDIETIRVSENLQGKGI